VPQKRLTDGELWACAEEYVRRHGYEAPIMAGMRADELLDKADFEGAANWTLIVKRINELLARPAGAAN
jgi:hypothetical protein